MAHITVFTSSVQADPSVRTRAGDSESTICCYTSRVVDIAFVLLLYRTLHKKLKVGLPSERAERTPCSSLRKRVGSVNWIVRVGCVCGTVSSNQCSFTPEDFLASIASSRCGPERKMIFQKKSVNNIFVGFLFYCRSVPF